MAMKAESSSMPTSKMAGLATTAEYGSISQYEAEQQLPVAEAVQVLPDVVIEGATVNDNRIIIDEDDRQQRRNIGGGGCDVGCVLAFGTFFLLVSVVIAVLLFPPPSPAAVPNNHPSSRSSSAASSPPPYPPPTPSNRNPNPMVPTVPPPTTTEPPPSPPLPPPSKKVIASLDLPRQGPLMDLIHIIDDDSEARILNEIASVQRDVPGCEVEVLLVNSIVEQQQKNGHDRSSSWLNPKEFATALFNKWALGSTQTNNGVLILFLLDTRRIEVEVGAALDKYMNQQWTTAMLKRRAVPEFRRGNYGFGIYNVVMSVSDRLRDIENGIAVPYREQTTNTNNNRNYGPSNTSDIDSENSSWGLFIFLAGILSLIPGCVFCSSFMDNFSDYPMGRGKLCHRCGQCNWKHQRWEHISDPTYHSYGLQRRHCICKQCHATDSIGQRIPMLTRTRRSNRSNDYYSTSDSNGGGGGSWGHSSSGHDGGGGGGHDDGGGHSSGHGGGGADW